MVVRVCRYEVECSVHAFLFPAALVIARYDRFAVTKEKKGHLTLESMVPLSVVTLSPVAVRAH
jgi:hypothetical protein